MAKAKAFSRPSRSIFCLLPASIILLAAILARTAFAEGNASFDGAWMTALTCPASPDGALGFSFQFPGAVKGGVFHGERGTPHEPGWLQLDGKIQADGSASMIAEGVTNIRAYAVANAAKARRMNMSSPQSSKAG
jgi:hypothetical protein